jgi:hypothetical protein
MNVNGLSDDEVRVIRDDPRVVASHERLLAIPRWRVIQTFRAQREHIRLVFRVEREARARHVPATKDPHDQ